MVSRVAYYVAAFSLLISTHSTINSVNGASSVHSVQSCDNGDPSLSIAFLIKQLSDQAFCQLSLQVRQFVNESVQQIKRQHDTVNISRQAVDKFPQMDDNMQNKIQNIHDLFNESFLQMKREHNAVIASMQLAGRRSQEREIESKQVQDVHELLISVMSSLQAIDRRSQERDIESKQVQSVHELLIEMKSQHDAVMRSLEINRRSQEQEVNIKEVQRSSEIHNKSFQESKSEYDNIMRTLQAIDRRTQEQEIKMVQIQRSNELLNESLQDMKSQLGTVMTSFQAANRCLHEIHINNQSLNESKLEIVCSAKQDLTFIVDGSGSICPAQPCENWNFTRQFIHRIVDSMTIGQNDTTVTVIVFSTVSTVQWNFSAHANKTSLLNAIDNLPFPDGSTAIVPALDLLTSTVYTTDQGDRPDIADTAIIITDGKPKEPISDLKDAINKVHNEGIRTLVVGVTENINIETLRLLSSPPRKENETFFTAQDYSSLDTIRDELRSRTCNTTMEAPGTCSPTSEVCDCSDIKASGQIASGIYEVCAGLERDRVCFKAFCDMDTDNRTSLVFQKRKDGKVNFYRTWAEYKEGFGDLSGEFWLGNEKLYLLTSKRNYKLRVDLEDWEGNKRFAEYGRFSISSSVYNYTLEVSGYSGNAGDSLTYHNGQQFSTKDVDNHISNSTSCAVLYRGAWWYNTCQQSNLNGIYHRGNYSGSAVNAEGVQWNTWPGRWYSLKSTEMKLVPTA